MRQTILLVALIIAGSSVARSQTSFKNIGDSRNDSSSSSSAPTRCMGWQLSVSRVSEDAGAGQRAVTYAFTNTSSSPCTLRGYPKFVLLNRAGRRMRGTYVIRRADPVEVVTLAPGGKAWFTITYSACSTVGSGRCRFSTKVRIKAPRSRRAFVRRERLDPFGGRVNLSPVRSSET